MKDSKKYVERTILVPKTAEPDSPAIEGQETENSIGNLLTCTSGGTTYNPGDQICVNEKIWKCNGNTGNWTVTGTDC